jgi:hypothetical protein
MWPGGVLGRRPGGWHPWVVGGILVIFEDARQVSIELLKGDPHLNLRHRTPK